MRKNKEIENLERQIEEHIANRHRASIARWKEAVAKATQFFKSQYFKEYYAEDRATVGPKIKQALNYPTFEFDREGLERFYKIQSLGFPVTRAELKPDAVRTSRSTTRQCSRR